ncbi:MAG TPA: glycosyltransferase family 2 protein [Lacipirellulaceae bacterium]|jgi:dolichol-phosphate mannosyltransferase|nr:glycosyltransferase family 2 protein [Lacipirellulaceae bacterium]
MLSVIIPVLNEAESLPTLVAELHRFVEAQHYDVQTIIVDDGSRDATWSVIQQLASNDPRVLGIRLRRNFGKAAALSAGFHAAEGERIITIDGDLQDNPAEIAKLLAKLDEGFDVVSGWKRERFDPWHKVLPSRVFNWLVSHLMGVYLHDHNCGLKAYRREVMHEIRLYGELHRFVPVLAAAKGFRVGEIVVQHRPRKFGKSKYGVSRLSKGLLDLLTVKFIVGYGQRPQHMLGTAGLGAFLLGALGLAWLALRWTLSRVVGGWTPVNLHETAALFYCLGLFIIGAQFLSIGLLGEMIAAHWVRDTDTYSIAEHTSPRLARKQQEAEGAPSMATPRSDTL